MYLNGERVAVNNLYNTNHGQYYYGSDILGSVKFVTGGGGQELKRIEYDVFGSIYKGNSPYGLETGYTGKPYDSITGLSDYGFRDYSPTHARFITEDPIRDGENWFSYVGNNPVNWVDPWGLSASDGQKTAPVNKDSVNTTHKKQSTFNSWSNKKTGDKLTAAEQKLQKSIGIGEMIFGPIAGTVSAEATGGSSVIIGYYVMADGAYLYAEADNGRKAQPLSFFATLLEPSLIELNETTTIPFMSPY